MDENAFVSDDLLDEIASCLAQVRDHIYRTNVGAMAVEAGCHLFDVGNEPTAVGSRQGPVGPSCFVLKADG